MRACLAATGVTSTAHTVFQCFKGMFHPRLTDLFEALGVIGSAAHSIEILRNDGVISLRQRKPIHRLVAVVARVCSYCEANLATSPSLLVHIFYISDDNIRTRHEVWHCGTGFVLHRWHDHRFGFAVNKLLDLDRLHCSSDGNRSGYRSSV